MSDLNTKVKKLVMMRHNYRVMKTEMDELEADICADMEERQLVIAGIGMIKRRTKSNRTRWDHEALYSAVNRYIQDSPMGEDETLLQAAQFGAHVMQELANPSWRTTALRAIEIDPDEYCHKEFGGYTVEITEGVIDG